MQMLLSYLSVFFFYDAHFQFCMVIFSIFQLLSVFLLIITTTIIFQRITTFQKLLSALSILSLWSGIIIFIKKKKQFSEALHKLSWISLQVKGRTGFQTRISLIPKLNCQLQYCLKNDAGCVMKTEQIGKGQPYHDTFLLP